MRRAELKKRTSLTETHELESYSPTEAKWFFVGRPRPFEEREVGLGVHALWLDEAGVRRGRRLCGNKLVGPFTRYSGICGVSGERVVGIRMSDELLIG